MTNIRVEIEEVWKGLINEIGIDSLFDPHFGKFIDTFHNETENASQVHLELWSAILEQEIAWLSSFHFVLAENCIGDASEYRVPWALVGTACSQAVAIRKLSLIGLDIPAKAVYRTLVETLQIFLVTTADRKLLAKYQVGGVEEANKIWSSELRTKNLASKLSKIYSKFPLDDEILTLMTNWQKEEFSLTSQAIHLSYTMSFLASMPPTFDNDLHKAGIIGITTPLSIRTLSETCKSIWLYGRLGFRLLLEKFSDESLDPVHFNQEKQESIATLYGFSVIDQLIVAHWNDLE